jgi:pimeloyl-ACP methyl ester carboxylesterase
MTCTTSWNPATSARGGLALPHAELGERRVFYEEHGSGDPVLLVNGLGADHSAWALQTEYLQESFRVVVFDNPGVGQTEGPRGPYTTALFADVAVSLLGHLEIDRAHVVGASMGGMIVQQIAVRHPSVVRSLVVHCPWWDADPHTSALIRSWQAIARATGMLELSRQIWLWVFTPRYYAEHPEAFVELELLLVRMQPVAVKLHRPCTQRTLRDVKAGDIAGKVSGVKSVVNNIEVKP